MFKRGIIGLDIDEGSVVAAELFRENKKVYLGKYKVFSNLKELKGDPFFKGSGVILNIPTQLVLFRNFHMAPSFLKTKNKSKDIIKFLLYQNLPFKLEECFWDAFTLNSDLNLIAVKKETMERYIGSVEELGLRCQGASPSFVALHNVFIYNYPEKEKGSYAILNIRNSASDLLIYEAKKLWIYPLSIGKRDLVSAPPGLEKFSEEVRRIFNAHYLQHPPVSQNRLSQLSLCGQMGDLEGFVSSLKNLLGEFQLAVAEPFKNIGFSQRPSDIHQQLITQSLGLALAYFKAPLCLNINLIKERMKREFIFDLRNRFKNYLFLFGIVILISLLLVNIKLLSSLKSKGVLSKNNQLLVSSVLPEAKALKEERDRLQGLRAYLEKELSQHKLYLKFLAAISKSRPKYIEIQELQAQWKDMKLQVLVSGSSPSYEEINDFLANLKNNEGIKDVKTLFSTFPSDEVKTIIFKLTFRAE